MQKFMQPTEQYKEPKHPVSVLLNINTTIRNACAINLVLNYDELTEIDPAKQMVSAKG